MPIAICIKSFRGGPKSFFEEGNEYDYNKHITVKGKFMYSVTGERKDYITMFHSDESGQSPKFSQYFNILKEIREKKIKGLLMG